MISIKKEVTFYNRKKAIFTAYVDEDDDVVSVGKVINENLMPICLIGNFTLEAINKWLSKRAMPENREGFKEASFLYPGILRKHNRFSLSDQYWIRYNKSETYDMMNYFTNRYLEDVGNTFFEPWNVNRHNLATESPDLTTAGALKKRWIQEPVKNEAGEYPSCLIKAGSEKFHQTPLTEILSTITLKELNVVPFVEYHACVEGLQVCSKCRNFITSETEFVPASHIYYKEKRDNEHETIYQHMIKMCNKYHIEGTEEFLDKMIVADFFIRNTDRHVSNFGFIRSAVTGKILGFAPIFDLGSAFIGSDKDGISKSQKFGDREPVAVKNYIYSNKKFVQGLKEDNLLIAIESFPTMPEEDKDIMKQKVRDFYSCLRKQLKM